MSDQPLSELDILNEINDVDLSKVETSYPHLMSGNVPVNITKCEFGKDDKEDAKPYLLAEYSLANPWKTQPQPGEPSKVVEVGARGSKITQRIYIGKYESKTEPGKMETYGLTQLAQLREAVFGKAQPGDKFVPTDLIGQQCVVTLKFDPVPKNSKTGQTYPPSTSVTGWVKRKN